MTRSELVQELAQATGLSPAVSDVVVAAVFERLSEALASGERVELRGLGSFGLRPRGARVGRNPRTGTVVRVAPRKAPFFRMGKELRAILNPKAVPARTH